VVRTARDFEFIANAITIRIDQASTLAIVTLSRIIAVARVCGERIKIAGFRIQTTGGFILIANAVGIAVNQAAARAIISRRGIQTGAVLVCGLDKKVACREICASGDFQLIANSVAVEIDRTGAVTVVVRGRKIAVARICSVRVEIAG
jgi:hypothetical protein